MAAEDKKPRFEPPPWEQEAFDRFQREQQEVRAREELEIALKSVREQPGATTTAPQPGIAAGVDGGEQHEAEQLVGSEVSQARIDTMLIELRGEEGPASRPNMVLVNGAMGILSIGGLGIIIQAARLFSRARGASGANMMFAGLVALMMMAAGAGALAAAYMLFKKYHR